MIINVLLGTIPNASMLKERAHVHLDVVEIFLNHLHHSHAFPVLKIKI